MIMVDFSSPNKKAHSVGVGWLFSKLDFPGQANATLPHRGKSAPIPVAKAKRVGKIHTDHRLQNIPEKDWHGKQIFAAPNAVVAPGFSPASFARPLQCQPRKWRG
ncbi:MAG: hypothetical protein P8Z30_09805 [Acidobacteriota bacterium]